MLSSWRRNRWNPEATKWHSCIPIYWSMLLARRGTPGSGRGSHRAVGGVRCSPPRRAPTFAPRSAAASRGVRRAPQPARPHCHSGAPRSPRPRTAGGAARTHATSHPARRSPHPRGRGSRSAHDEAAHLRERDSESPRREAASREASIGVRRRSASGRERERLSQPPEPCVSCKVSMQSGQLCEASRRGLLKEQTKKETTKWTDRRRSTQPKPS